MGVAIRGLVDDSVDEFVRTGCLAWGALPRGGDVARARELLELDRVLVAEDGNVIAGGLAVYSLLLTVPGARLAMAGASYGFTHPTYRRRGILSALMRAQLDAAHDRGEALAGLFASDSSLYGRYGFGPASYACSLTVDHARSRLASPPRQTGDVITISAAEAMRTLPRVYGRLAESRNGMVARSETWWRWLAGDRAPDSASSNRPAFIAHRDGTGIDGYVIHRTGTPEGDDAASVELLEMTCLSSTAFASLWRHLLAVKGAARTVARRRPVDDPLLHLLEEPGSVVQTCHDELHLRLIDPARALERRRYPCRGTLVLRVHDGFCSWADGTYLVEAAPDGATCRTTGREPDLELDAAGLGSVYLGGVSMDQLRSAGRVEERTAGAVGVATALFSWWQQPFVPHVF